MEKVVFKSLPYIVDTFRLFDRNEYTSSSFTTNNSLMIDQLSCLKDLGIYALPLNKDTKVSDVISEAGEFLPCIFCSPEGFLKSKWHEMLLSKEFRNSCIVAINEAHCVIRFMVNFFIDPVELS